jgi:hypothetical protein
VFSGNDIVVVLNDADTTRKGVRVAVQVAGVTAAETYRYDAGRELRINLRELVDGLLRRERDEVSLDGLPTTWEEVRSAARTVGVTLAPFAATVLASEDALGFLALRAATGPDTDYMVSYVGEHGQLLSFLPNPVPVAVGGVLHISWLNRERRPIKLMARYHYANGSTATRVLQEVADAKERVQHWALPWAVVAAETPAFRQVDVWVRSAVNVNISTMRSYVVVPGTGRTRYLLFENSVGGWDNLLLQALATESHAYARETARFQDLSRTNATERVGKYKLLADPLAGLYENAVGAANFVATELMGTRQAYLITPSKITEVRVLNSELTSFEDNAPTLQLVIELEAVRIAKSFDTPALALPPSEVGSGYFVEDYIEDNYFE